MMDTSAWIAVTREDGETAGYLAGEDLLCERGIFDLIKPRKLKDAPGVLSGPLAILEVWPHGIVVADALLVKALSPSEKTIVSWPDVEHCLEPAVSGP